MPEHLAVVTTGQPELSPTSESEEMYLITVARAIESGRLEPVPTPAIAEALAVSVAAANEMVHRLAARGLLTYEPYRGVGLTPAGRTVAGRVLRTRRLWATFLAAHLGFDPVEADDQACHLEHVTAPQAVERLAAFLGNPAADPLGRPIPKRHAVATPAPATSLDAAPVGSRLEVVAVRAPAATVRFLAGEGIVPGARVTLAAAGDAGVLVEAAGPVHLTRDLAATVDVRTRS